MTTPRIWDRFLTERDKQVYAQSGYGKRGGFGTRPALFIIDVQYNFCGDRPEDILEGLKQYRTHCGREAWEAVAHIEPLLHLAREKNFPVFYTESARRADMLDSGVQVGKSHRGTEKTVLEGTHATQTVEPLAPRDADITVVDPTLARTVDPATLESFADYSPYEGMTFTGWPVATFVRGRCVMRDGAVLPAVREHPGGRYLFRQ